MLSQQIRPQTLSHGSGRFINIVLTLFPNEDKIFSLVRSGINSGNLSIVNSLHLILSFSFLINGSIVSEIKENKRIYRGPFPAKAHLILQLENT